MSRFRLDDDFFSPVRFDVSSIDNSSLGSEGSFSNEFLSTDFEENKITLEESVFISVQKNELKSKDGNIENSGSINTCTPVNKIFNDKSVANRKSLKLKLEKKYLPVSVRKESIESDEKKQDESLYKENTLDSHIATCNTSDESVKKSRSASLPSKDENATLKDTKQKHKGSIQPSKYDFIDEVQNLRTDKKSTDKFVENSQKLRKHASDVNCKDSSVMSTESKQNASKNKKSSNSSCQEESAVNNVHSSFEESIKKMIRTTMSSESAKLRQHVYMNQMAFFRELNKIKDTMERQHYVTTERLFKVIEELMQMNASLKLALANKD